MLLFAFLPAAALFAYGIWLQPLEGDLTRAGSFSQRQFGWNAPQTVFRQPLYANGPYDRPFDVVVVGDSFATAMPQYQWQNQLAAATGLSVITLSSYDVRLDDVLRSEVFAATPPRLLMLTLVERHFPEQLAKITDCRPTLAGEEVPAAAASVQGTAAAAPVAGDVPALAAPGAAEPAARQGPAIADPLELVRETRWSDLREVKIGYAAKVAMYDAIRGLTGREPGKVLRVALTRDDLFSNAAPDTTLIWRGDVRKTAQWQAAGLDELGCRIESLRRRVEANGVTRFVMVLPPDKLTAYRPWLAPPHDVDLSRLDELARRHPQTMPRIDRAIAATIAAGQRDVYLPNNTHWGIAGHLAAGQAVAEFVGPLVGSAGSDTERPSRAERAPTRGSLRPNCGTGTKKKTPDGVGRARGGQYRQVAGRSVASAATGMPVAVGIGAYCICWMPAITQPLLPSRGLVMCQISSTACGDASPLSRIKPWKRTLTT